MNNRENENMFSQESLALDYGTDPATSLTDQVQALIPPIPDYDPALVDRSLDDAKAGYTEFFLKEIPQEHAGGGPPAGDSLSDNLKAFWGGVYLTHIQPIVNKIKGAPSMINRMTKTQIEETIESIQNATSERRFLFVIKLLQIIVICGIP